MDHYPYEFAELQKNTNEELSKCCEQLFDILDSFADNKKGRAAVWSLQIMLLILAPVSIYRVSRQNDVRDILVARDSRNGRLRIDVTMITCFLCFVV